MTARATSAGSPSTSRERWPDAVNDAQFGGAGAQVGERGSEGGLGHAQCVADSSGFVGEASCCYLPAQLVAGHVVQGGVAGDGWRHGKPRHVGEAPGPGRPGHCLQEPELAEWAVEQVLHTAGGTGS